jgi:hypothetical protein
LACSDFTSTAGGAATRAEHIGSATFELRFPRRDLIGMDVELLRQLSRGPVALDGGQSHLRLEGR